jgi:hypothetical protein
MCSKDFWLNKKEGDESCSKLQHLDETNRTECENREHTTGEDRTKTT